MVSPLSGSLARAVYAAAKGIFLDASLVRKGVSGGASFDPTAAPETTYTCKAIVEAYSLKARADGLVDVNDRKVLILAESLSVIPAVGDKITIQGITFLALEISTDPATAVWEVRGRK